MKYPSPAWLEFGFFPHRDRPLGVLDLVRARLRQGARLGSIAQVVVLDASAAGAVVQGDEYDGPFEVPISGIEDLERLAFDRDRTLYEVQLFSGRKGRTPEVALLPTLMPESAAEGWPNPIGTISDINRASRRALVREFQQLVEWLRPAYASLAVEAWIVAPPELAEEATGGLFDSGFISARGDRDTSALHRLVADHGGRTAPLADGVYFEFWVPDDDDPPDDDEPSPREVGSDAVGRLISKWFGR